MSIKVRLGKREDIKALVEVECSDIDVWYHYSPEGRGNPASYGELTSWERVMHGGPWMDAAALNKYWDRIERLGIIPLVAEFKGKVVGHLDVIFSEEPELGLFLYLDVLTVHRNFRGIGVATALIEEAVKLAKERKVEFMLVQPEEYEGPSGLTYRRCGFKKAFNAYSFEMATKNAKIQSGARLMSIAQDQRAPLKTHTMLCGWYNISEKIWDYAVNPDVEILQAFSCHQLTFSILVNGSIHYVGLKQNYFDHLTATLCLWAPTPLNEKSLTTVFSTASAIAKCLGIKKLVTCSIEKYVALLQKLGLTLKSVEDTFLKLELEDQ